MNNSKFAHHLLVRWKKGDIHPSSLINEINRLIVKLQQDDFDPKGFHDLSLAIHQELEYGTGVVFIKHSSIGDLDKKNKREIFLKLCQFLGAPVAINKAGDLVREVKNIGLKDTVEKPARGHLTDQSLAFHSDRADITAMLCETIPKSGGEFKICSSASLLSELEKMPKVLEILTRDIPHDLRDEGVDGLQVCYHPIISYQRDFVVRYIRKFVDSIVRHGLEVNRDILQALDKVEAIVNTEGFYEEITFQENDMIFFNNHITLHARNAFVDDEENRRCALRIWLASAFSRELPDSFAPIFHSTQAGSLRGGVV